MLDTFSDIVEDQIAIPAVFMRGGFSKGLMFHARDLPQDRASRDRLFLAALGSPDPYGQQLDGMGGGTSSLSKVCIIAPSREPNADIEYTFAKVDIRQAKVFYELACGSMASAVGPFAVDEGLVAAPPDGEVILRIRDMNADRTIVSRFFMRAGKAAVSGDFAIDGVPGTGAPIRLEFLKPGGIATGRLLPTGNAIDVTGESGDDDIEFSFVDAANPIVFIHARSFGLKGSEAPAEIERHPDMQRRLGAVRRQIATRLGMPSDGDDARLPRVALVAEGADYTSREGRNVGAGEIDILVRMMSGNTPHLGLPLTTALCLGVACRIAGTVPNRILAGRDGAEGKLRIGHPNGVSSVWALGRRSQDEFVFDSVGTEMTQRRLFEGRVLIPAASALSLEGDR